MGVWRWKLWLVCSCEHAEESVHNGLSIQTILHILTIRMQQGINIRTGSNSPKRESQIKLDHALDTFSGFSSFFITDSKRGL